MFVNSGNHAAPGSKVLEWLASMPSVVEDDPRHRPTVAWLVSVLESQIAEQRRAQAS
jgi:hypothetical protein